MYLMQFFRKIVYPAVVAISEWIVPFALYSKL